MVFDRVPVLVLTVLLGRNWAGAFRPLSVGLFFMPPSLSAQPETSRFALMHCMHYALHALPNTLQMSLLFPFMFSCCPWFTVSTGARAAMTRTRMWTRMPWVTMKMNQGANGRQHAQGQSRSCPLSYTTRLPQPWAMRCELDRPCGCCRACQLP